MSTLDEVMDRKRARAEERVQQLARRETVKHLTGQRVDRIYREVPIRSAWSASVPTTFVEPTSRFCWTGWIRNRDYRTAFGTPGPPVVDGDPARGWGNGHYDIRQVGTSIATDYTRKHVGQSQNSSFIATRHGLCRMVRRPDTAGNSGAFSILPFGCATTYPSWFEASPGGSIPQGSYVLAPTAENPHGFIGSGCLPVFFMDSPTPWSPPVPPVTLGVDRFGPTVYSKFRSLKITIEAFPFLNNWGTGSPSLPRWANSTPQEFFKYAPMPKPWARVILFKRKSVASEDPLRHNVFPPIFPPTPIGSSMDESRTTSHSDITYDTPAYGNMAKRFPSTVDGSPFVILEDFVVELGSSEMPRLGERHQATGFAGSTSTDGPGDHVMVGYGGSGPITMGGLADVSYVTGDGFLRPRDADGIPHCTQKAVIERTYNDNGRTVQWSHTGMDPRAHEGIAPRNPPIRPSVVADSGTNPRVYTTDASNSTGGVVNAYEIDLCREELFVTVITGTHLRAGPNKTDALNPPADIFPGVQQLAWGMDPASSCTPAIVSIETKWWYTDPGITVPPSQVKITDAGGISTYKLETQQRPKPTTL